MYLCTTSGMFMVLPAVQQVMTLARPTVSVRNAREAAVGRSFGSGGGGSVPKTGINS